jgi:anthranilate phosphoribosyltransferase
LKGETVGPAREIILANSALIEHLVNGTELKGAYAKMEETLESGAAYENILKIREFLG